MQIPNDANPNDANLNTERTISIEYVFPWVVSNTEKREEKEIQEWDERNQKWKKTINAPA